MSPACPRIVNPVIPGQEEGNARLLEILKIGAVAENSKALPQPVRDAFAHRGRQWQAWRTALDGLSRPDAALRLAELVLDQARHATRAPRPLHPFEERSGRDGAPRPGVPKSACVQLCDFHIHTSYSDGRLAFPEVIDFHGRRGFDCICITDHAAEPRLAATLAAKSPPLNLALPAAVAWPSLNPVGKPHQHPRDLPKLAAWTRAPVSSAIETRRRSLTSPFPPHRLDASNPLPTAPIRNFTPEKPAAPMQIRSALI